MKDGQGDRVAAGSKKMSNKQDLFSISPPFLILFRDGSWRVAREIFPHDKGVGYIEPYALERSGEPDAIVLSGLPWNVGNDTWELDFGTRIIRLNQPDWYRHPGWSLWTHWLKHVVTNCNSALH